jgi:NAD(P)-dependent dehydrogenase (short-subunit alcohol dehydrogenase family)
MRKTMTSMQAALVTGAGKRIGRFFAEALAQDGWFVYVHYNASRQEATETVAAIVKAGGQAKALRADLASLKASEGLIGRCAAAGGPPLTCLVNSASLFELDRPGDFTAAQWDRHQAVNLRAPALLARDFARQLDPQHTGCIVNLLDQKLWNLNPDFYSYTISKVGLQGVTEVLARALAPRVRVNAIAPGITLPALRQSDNNFRAAQARAPLGVGASPDDLVRALRFILATPSLTGETIIVDGGEHLGKRPRDVIFEKKTS